MRKRKFISLEDKDEENTSNLLIYLFSFQFSFIPLCFHFQRRICRVNKIGTVSCLNKLDKCVTNPSFQNLYSDVLMIGVHAVVVGVVYRVYSEPMPRKSMIKIVFSCVVLIRFYPVVISAGFLICMNEKHYVKNMV